MDEAVEAEFRLIGRIASKTPYTLPPPQFWKDRRRLKVLGMGKALPGPPVAELLTRIEKQFGVNVVRRGSALANRLGIETRHVCRDGQAKRSRGIIQAFWSWHHRQVKKPGDPDLDKSKAYAWYQIWEQEGRAGCGGHRTKDPKIVIVPVDPVPLPPLTNPLLASARPRGARRSGIAGIYRAGASRHAVFQPQTMRL